MTTRIDGERLLRDLYELRKIGEYKTGVHRPTYSPEDVQSRHWLAARLSAAGLDPEIDGIGNVLGRARGDGPKLLLGSHVETQPHAGWLDGALVPGLLTGIAHDPDLWIEDKGLSLVVHARLTAEPERVLEMLHGPVERAAAAAGLGVRPGRGVLEICLPGIDKGTAIREPSSATIRPRFATPATTSATCPP